MAHRIFAIAIAALFCSGCTYWQNQTESLLKGQALIADNVYLLKGKADYDASQEKPPTPCDVSSINTWTSKSPDEAEKIRKCTYAMMLLIDVRWAHFSDVVHGTVTYGNAALDTASVGLNAAGTIASGSAPQILSAIAGGLGAFKATLNQDVLYKNSVELILLQMQTDRAKQASVIYGKLKEPIGYTNMYEAAIDLYIYARAGSWTQALTSLQASTSVRQQACEQQLMFTKLNDDNTVAASNTDAGKNVSEKDQNLLAISNNQAAYLNACAAYKIYKTNVKTQSASEKTTETTNSSSEIKFAFTSGSAEINKDALAKIQALAEAFKAGDSIKVEINTNNTGSKAANQAIYKKRLKSIADALVGKNAAISQDKITAKWVASDNLTTTISLVKATK